VKPFGASGKKLERGSTFRLELNLFLHDNIVLGRPVKSMQDKTTCFRILYAWFLYVSKR
jgi:hypothetical protein